MYNSSRLISCWFFGSIYVIWASRWVTLDVCTRMSGVYFTLRLPRGNARWKNEENKFTEFCTFPATSYRDLFSAKKYLIVCIQPSKPGIFDRTKKKLLQRAILVWCILWSFSNWTINQLMISFWANSNHKFSIWWNQRKESGIALNVADGKFKNLFPWKCKIFSMVWNFEKQNLMQKYRIEEKVYTDMFEQFVQSKKVCTIPNLCHDNLI